MIFLSKESEDLDFKIFKELKEASDYLSLQYLSDKFKISRQILRDHIKNFKKHSYKIDAISHLGYKLKESPDKSYPWEIKYNLGTKFVGQSIYFKESVSSTQNFIRHLGEEGVGPGTVVLAEKQLKGKGRMGRDWVSPLGGIYLSCLFRPQFILVNEICQIALVMSLACVKAIKKQTGIAAAVKWPNDIYIGNKKIGGILCEANSKADKISFISVGIGINVNTKKLPSVATSLASVAKRNFSKKSITKEILRQIEACYLKLEAGKNKDLLESWQEHCFLWGRRLRVKILNKVVEGEAFGIDEHGYLLLRRDTGLIDKIVSGDIIKVC